MVGGGSCRMAAVAFDLQAPHSTVMRSNSVLTPLRLYSLPPPFPLPFYPPPALACNWLLAVPFLLFSCGFVCTFKGLSLGDS